MLAIVSKDKALIISGTGDVIEPEDGIVAIGSGSMYALAAQGALLRSMSAPATMEFQRLSASSTTP